MSGFEVFGVAAALPGIIDICIRYGKLLETKVKLFKTAMQHSKLQGFVLELCTGGINDMLLFFRNVHGQLDKAFQLVLHDSVSILRNALLKAYEAFPEDSFIDKITTTTKLKYAFFDAKRVEEAVTEMEVWQDRFLKRADIYLKFVFEPKYGVKTAMQAEAPNSSGPVSTKQSIDLSNNDEKQLFARLQRIESGRRKVKGPLLIKDTASVSCMQLENSSLWMAAARKDALPSLIEYRSYKAADASYTKALASTVRNVASKLREVDDSTMHIMQCQGFSEDPINSRFALHFSVPTGQTNPRSLRTLLADPANVRGKKHSLSDRLQLAQSIATAVLYVHSCGFVHKNIRPDNIIIFDELSAQPDQTYPYAIGKPYLAGYDGVRMEEAQTFMLGVEKWQERIYMPAERLADQEHRVKFSWVHDVYSLGVILLEIALWENFTNPSGAIGKTLKSADVPGDVLEKNWLKQVPRVLGNKYAEAVSACFAMLKDGDGKAFEDEDGIEMGTTFISRVLDKLEDIRL
jgi:hypothetical protein